MHYYCMFLSCPHPFSLPKRKLSPDQQLSQVKYNFGAAIYVLFLFVTEIGGIFNALVQALDKLSFR